MKTKSLFDCHRLLIQVHSENFRMKPTPEPVDTSQLPKLAHDVIRDAKFPMLATVESNGQPRLRPVSPVRVDSDFTVYVANLRSYHKTKEIAENPAVELAYLAENHDQVRITGIAEVLENSELIQEIWDANPLLQNYLGSIENPELVIYRIRPNKVRFMREWALKYYEVPV